MHGVEVDVVLESDRIDRAQEAGWAAGSAWACRVST